MLLVWLSSFWVLFRVEALKFSWPYFPNLIDSSLFVLYPGINEFLFADKK